MANPKKGNQRVQLDLPGEFIDEIDRVTDECGFTTRKETMVAAIGLLGWVAGETMADRKVGSLEDSTFREIIIAAPKLLPARSRVSDRSASARGHSPHTDASKSEASA